jgi:hypothetical protein
MTPIELPFWLDGEELGKLKRAAADYWAAVEDWIRWPLSQFDPMTCSLGILDLLAYNRDIQRFRDEPESLYRLRVKYALVNAQDAGQRAGFERIFERLGIGYLETEERVDPVDWDVILLNLSDSQIGQNQALIEHVVRKYGRTCRRYQLNLMNPLTITVPAFDVGHVWDYDVAKDLTSPYSVGITMPVQPGGNVWTLDVAKL